MIGNCLLTYFIAEKFPLITSPLPANKTSSMSIFGPRRVANDRIISESCCNRTSLQIPSATLAGQGKVTTHLFNLLLSAFIEILVKWRMDLEEGDDASIEILN
jgi:hypothetical protein